MAETQECPKGLLGTFTPVQHGPFLLKFPEMQCSALDTGLGRPFEVGTVSPISAEETEAQRDEAICSPLQSE